MSTEMEQQKLQDETIKILKTMNFNSGKNIENKFAICTNKKKILKVLDIFGVKDLNGFFVNYRFHGNPENIQGIRVYPAYDRTEDKLKCYFFHYAKGKYECLLVDDLRVNTDYLTVSNYLGLPVWWMFAHMTNGLTGQIPLWPEEMSKFMEVDFQKYFEKLVNK